MDIIDQLLDKFNEVQTPGMEIEITPDQIKYVCDKFMEIQQPVLVRIKSPCYVVGDVHGQFHDVKMYIDLLGVDKKYVFLGDYVDRGFQAVETVIYLFCLKIKYSNNFILLRGNHELEGVCKYCQTNALYTEIMDRYQEDEKMVFELLTKAFTYLPLGCLINDSVLCVHGCVPVQIDSLSWFDQLQLPLKPEESDKANTVDKAIIDLLWSDPIADESFQGYQWRTLADGDRQLRYIYNTRRLTAQLCPEKQLLKFCDDNGLDLIVRGHEAPSDGFSIGVSGRILTVFGASNYMKQGDFSTILSINEDGEMHIHVFGSALQNEA